MKKSPTLKIMVGSDKVQSVAPKESTPAPLPALEMVTNPMTQSKFFVLGRTKDGLRVSMRFVAAHVPHSGYRVLFRVRVGDQDRGDYIENVYAHMHKKFPTVHWTATPVSTPDKRSIYPHASIEGILLMEGTKAYEAERVSKGLDESPFIEELWYAVIVQFADAGWELDREQFGRWVKQQALLLCTEAPPPAAEQPVHVQYKAHGLVTSEKKLEMHLTKKEQKAADLSSAGLD